MRVIIAAGGTGGHINPGLAIAKFIKQRRPGSEILFIGTKDGMEKDLVPREGFDIRFIDVRGFRRSLSAYNLGALRRIFTSVKEATKIIKEFAPDIVIGMGGYVSGPVILAASRLKIPTAIHEQNSMPGMTIRILANFADCVMISFKDSEKYFKRSNHKLTLTGNPVRQEMLFADKAAAKKELGLDGRPLVLSYAGSLGSRKFNETIIDFISLHIKKAKFQHIHSTGSFGIKWVPDRIKQKGIDIESAPHVRVYEYIYNMPKVMAAADILICRAGALTLSEIAVMGKCAILIPSPNVTNNHQYYNARSFSDQGAAVLLEEKDITGEKLLSEVERLLSDPDKINEIGENARKLAVFDSTQKMYDACMSLIRKH